MAVYLTVHEGSGATLDDVNNLVAHHESVAGPLVEMSTQGNESLFKFRSGNPLNPPYAVVSKAQDGAGGGTPVCSGAIWLAYQNTPCVATRS